MDNIRTSLPQLTNSLLKHTSQYITVRTASHRDTSKTINREQCKTVEYRLLSFHYQVIQRRQDGSVDFYRNWAEYKEGFGNVNTEFWLGNEQINRLTADGSFELLIEMTDHLDDMKFARYSHFRIDTEDSNYALNISGYTGTAGDSLAVHNGEQFTTKDRDNDKHSGNCAELYKGGWWYNRCGDSNLNGLYLTPGTDDSKGISWYHFHNNRASLKKTVMMVKRAP
ncbi:angiopoietin-related protein 2-like [Antedon mediterranea]|uniref:angiopoietin-related protein 2-like n=1 Tax=Antedon mediterranea TaxID=105859 RepID=UPI003AF45613